MYDEAAVLDEYGISSHNLIWYRVLDGDKSDNISGVRGLGLKTIQKKLPFLSENRIVEMDEVVNELPDHKDTIELNYKLMQLSDVDISASTKTKIVQRVNEPINRLIKFQFEKMFLEDKLYTALPNLTSWLLTNFNQLNHYAEKTHNK
jgi:5'-3' exonuclease